MKKFLIPFAAVAALAVSAAGAEPLRLHAADNYVKNGGTSFVGGAWKTGLVVKVNGVKTFYPIGSNGLTASIRASASAAEAWAEGMTGVDLTPVGREDVSETCRTSGAVTKCNSTTSPIW